MPGPFVGTENSKLAYNLVWDVNTLAWVVMTQPEGGGGSGGDVNLIEVGGDAIALGQTTMSASLPVVLASDHSPIEVTGDFSSDGVTDAEMRAYQTATGTFTASGQSVTLSLNGATGAAVNFIDSAFDGTVRFYTSCDGGVTYVETQAINTFTGEVTNRLLPAISPSRIWAFALVGGETHVRVTTASGTSGSCAVTIKANDGAPNPVSLAVTNSAGGDTSLPLGGVVMLGKTGSTGVRPLTIHNARYEWGGVYFGYVLSVPPTNNVSTITNTNDTATSTQLAAQNVNRLYAWVTNTSSSVLYVLLENGGTASATRFTKRLAQWETWPIPEYWIGEIKGVWATDPNDGVAIVTEI